ncbi:MAG: zinc-ribbon domain-containing protein [Candidatus Lokiarchaeota archaeon]|nr:zinc-ribbon domain-containing protein [Candidatus Lokiarchaeota archaeon]
MDRRPLNRPQAAPITPTTSQSTKGSFCARCGAKNDASARFCNKCGGAIG